MLGQFNVLIDNPSANIAHLFSRGELTSSSNRQAAEPKQKADIIILNLVEKPHKRRNLQLRFRRKGSLCNPHMRK